MSLQTVVAVGLALVFGICAAVGVNFATRPSEESSPDTDSSPVESPPPPTVEMFKVVVAAKHIPRHTPVTPAQVKLEEFPKSLVPAGALTRIEDAVQRLSLNSVVTNQVLVDGHLAR